MKNEFKGKTIIIGIPNHFGLPERFKENLEYLGFEVLLIDHPTKSPRIPILDSIIHNYKKIFKKDRTHKGKIKALLTEKYHLQQLSELQSKKDFALVIRPDLFSKKVIRKIVDSSNYTVAYQWDGIDRFPEVKDYIDFFDKFYVFDEEDALRYPNCHHTTNFYFDDLLDFPSTIEYDVYFVGTFMKNRFELLVQLLEKINLLNINSLILISMKRNKNEAKILTRLNSKIIEKGISFKENLHFLKKSKIVIDFKNDIHKGLSFRTFEAIGFGKKLITNNEIVKKYKFYNPNNILVIEEINSRELETFIKTPYDNSLNDEIQYYSFTNWIKRNITNKYL